ncbi:MAG TPA: hypothetical protein VIA06_06300 [Candidatus Dormibacteraeota bacterium]|jgi:hypothetical protein|nr:hypothetical protein [Candidatus Dormibacteraeota bacterium]
MGLDTFNGIHFRPDTEVAVGACIDHLSTRTDVDMLRIAFYGGGEPGGWVAIRAAAHEPRIAACIADPYVADTDAILSILHRADIVAVAEPGATSTAPVQAEQTSLFYRGEPGRGYPRLVAEPERIRCPLLCLNDMGDSEELRRQAANAVDGGERGEPPPRPDTRGRNRLRATDRQLQPQACGDVRLAR